MVSKEEMENFFVGGVMEKSKSANFECLFQKENIPFEEPTSFGADFEPRGTFRFIFITGVNKKFIPYFLLLYVIFKCLLLDQKELKIFNLIKIYN